MSSTPETVPETPAWMLALEKKRQRVHRLAHEVGAGSPCLLCKDDCPGLDLHFWRKLCRNCKCKKEDHDVTDDCGCEQFEILLGSGQSKNRPKKAFLELLEQQTSAAVAAKRVAFDWVPPDAPPDLAAEYMQALPASKLPISGSDGALYRRQQLERQLPLHDLDSNQCHQLSDFEIENFKKYLDNLKSNVVGQGRVTKLAMPASHSADSLRSMNAFNSSPKPFHALVGSDFSNREHESFSPTPVLDSHPGNHGLKPPSAFWPKGTISPGRTSPEPFCIGKDLNVGDVAFSSVADRGAMFGVMLSPSTKRSQAQGGIMEKSSAQTINVASSVSVSGKPQVTNTLYGNLGMCDRGVEATLAKKKAPLADIAWSSNVPGECLDTHSIGGVSNNEQRQAPIQNEDIALLSRRDMVQKPIDSQILRDHFPEQIAECNKIPGSKWVPAYCPECHLKAENGQLVQEQLCTNVAHSVLASPGLVAAMTTSPLQPTLSSKDSNMTEKHNSVRDTHPTEVTSTDLESETESSRRITDGIKIPVGVSCGLSTSENVGVVEPSQTSNLPEVIAVASDSRGTSPADNTHRQPFALEKGILRKPSERENNRKSPVGGERPHDLLEHNSWSPLNRGSPAFGISSVTGMPHTAALYAHNALHSPSAFEPQDTMSPCIASLSLEENVSVVADEGAGEWPSKETCPLQLDLHCAHCQLDIFPGEVVVCADRAGPSVVWHPKCFVCNTCQEMLVDLVYFFSKGKVYCGRHFAELLDIPRCSACDELIFVKEHTVAEGQTFHVKHFCCFECDEPLGGKQYVPKDGQPVCLSCYGQKYGKKCQTCQSIIDAKLQGVAWKDLHWHATSECFCCSQCDKSLLGGRFAVRDNRPFCSKECIQEAMSKV